MNNLLLKRSESGRTMLEMLGVLGIMGIIMYGAIAGINYGMNTYKINQTYNEVQEAVQGIEDLYSWTREYPSRDVTKDVCENDVFSRSCSPANDSIPNVFNGKITVIADGSTFYLKYTDIKEAECQRLLEMEWGDVNMNVNNNDQCASNNTIYFCPKTTDSSGAVEKCYTAP